MKIFLACSLTLAISMFFIYFMNRKHMRDFHKNDFPVQKEIKDVKEIIGDTIGDILADANIIVDEIKN